MDIKEAIPKVAKKIRLALAATISTTIGRAMIKQNMVNPVIIAVILRASVARLLSTR